MSKLSDLNPTRVFHYFEQISDIPRGSGNQGKISDFCEAFAKKHKLKYIRDDANNIIIFKDATYGYENTQPVILQGHLDMVCQKTAESEIDFQNDGVDIYVDGDFIKARGTTLGADNGIAVAMILAILESHTIPHPPIEAVFTTDEETGMIGANTLDFSKLKSKIMINIDSEEQDVLTVSCAGGSDFKVFLPLSRNELQGTHVTINLKGLKGGHSGIEINAGRVNADILAGRILNYAKKISDFSLISVSGGDKRNAIPRSCTIELVTDNPDAFKVYICEYAQIIKSEISDREPDFNMTTEIKENGIFSVMEKADRDKLINMILSAPNGVMVMSTTIENLVETSLNLGVLETDENQMVMEFALRSNKMSALTFLKERMTAFAEIFDCDIETGGSYPPWELVSFSPLQKLYISSYQTVTQKDIRVSAIHAGLECAVFADNIKDLDCISVGPDMFDVHTTSERLSISSTETVYNVIVELLKNCK